MKLLIPQGRGLDAHIQPEPGDHVALADRDGRPVTDWQIIPYDWTVTLDVPAGGAEHVIFRDCRDHDATWYGDIDRVRGPHRAGHQITLQPPGRLVGDFREVPLVS